MASTLKIGDAVNLLGQRYPKLLLDGNAARLSDEVIQFMWTRYPWRQSLAKLYPFFVTREESDYTAPFIVFPTDFFSLQEAWLREYTGYRQDPPLNVKPDLIVSGSCGTPESISYQPEIGGFRLYPRPSFSSPDWFVEGIYKKALTKVTNETVQSYVYPWDDRYFKVFRKGLSAICKDELLGNKQEAMMEGQEFVGLLEWMAASEGLHSGNASVHPQRSLELGG
jgi:hypothetical protein